MIAEESHPFGLSLATPSQSQTQSSSLYPFQRSCAEDFSPRMNSDPSASAGSQGGTATEAQDEPATPSQPSYTNASSSEMNKRIDRLAQRFGCETVLVKEDYRAPRRTGYLPTTPEDNPVEGVLSSPAQELPQDSHSSDSRNNSATKNSSKSFIEQQQSILSRQSSLRRMETMSRHGHQRGQQDKHSNATTTAGFESTRPSTLKKSTRSLRHLSLGEPPSKRGQLDRIRSVSTIYSGMRTSMRGLSEVDSGVLSSSSSSSMQRNTNLDVVSEGTESGLPSSSLSSISFHQRLHENTPPARVVVDSEESETSSPSRTSWTKAMSQSMRNLSFAPSGDQQTACIESPVERTAGGRPKLQDHGARSLAQVCAGFKSLTSSLVTSNEEKGASSSQSLSNFAARRDEDERDDLLRSETNVRNLNSISCRSLKQPRRLSASRTRGYFSDGEMNFVGDDIDDDDKKGPVPPSNGGGGERVVLLSSGTVTIRGKSKKSRPLLKKKSRQQPTSASTSSRSQRRLDKRSSKSTRSRLGDRRTAKAEKETNLSLRSSSRHSSQRSWSEEDDENQSSLESLDLSATSIDSNPEQQQEVESIIKVPWNEFPSFVPKEQLERLEGDHHNSFMEGLSVVAQPKQLRQFMYIRHLSTGSLSEEEEDDDDERG